MKAQERHELKENDLASWLQYGLWNFIRQNGSYILLVLAFSFLGYQLWSLYERKQSDALRTAWDELRSADTADDPFKAVQEVIDHNDIKPVRAQAHLKLGIMYDRLIAWPEEMTTLKLARPEALDTALSNFKQALELSDDPIVTAKARLGIASVYEDKGAWDQAKKEYESIADPKGPYAGTPFVALAESRLRTLDDRRAAPRLAALIPPPAAPKPLIAPLDSGVLPGGLPGSNAPSSSGSTNIFQGLGSGGILNPNQTSPFPTLLNPNSPLGPTKPSSSAPSPEISPPPSNSIAPPTTTAPASN